MQLDSAQKAAINRSFRTFPGTNGGQEFADFLQEQLLDEIELSNVGISAAAADVDSLAKGGGHFTWDPDATTGLQFAYKAGRFHNGYSAVAVSAGSVTLASSATNYVEVDRAGAVSSNTTSFTAGRLPLYQVTTSASAIAAADVVSKKPLLTLVGPHGVNGAMLSTAAQTKTLQVDVGTLSATGAVKVQLPNVACRVVGVRLVVDTTVAADDTNYWVASAINKGPAGSGTTPVLAVGAANGTQATGGAALTAYVSRSLTLHGTSANLDCAANDVLVVTLTKTAAAANLVGLVLSVDVTFQA